MLGELLAVAQNLLAWYNTVFAAFFAIGLFFTLLQLLGFGHGDADVDHDVDAHIDADADADADVDAHVDVDAHAVADHDAHAHAGEAATVGPLQAMAQFVGIGRVPVSSVLMMLCYTIGITGWVANALLRTRYESDRALFLTSLLIALATGLLVVRLAAGLLGRYMPSVLTSAVSRREMVGLTGEAALPISERFGRVSVKDRYGTLHQLNCRVPAGVEPVPKGARVILTKYLPDEDMYYVGRAG